MNIYLFWILFLALWAIVPLMIIKGRVDEEPKIQTSPKVKAKKKGWFNQLISSPTFLLISNYYNSIDSNIMNIYLFWILFLALWAIVPLMIIKGRVDEESKVQTAPKVKEKKKGWFN